MNRYKSDGYAYFSLQEYNGTNSKLVYIYVKYVLYQHLQVYIMLPYLRNKHVHKTKSLRWHDCMSINFSQETSRILYRDKHCMSIGTCYKSCERHQQKEMKYVPSFFVGARYG